MFLAALLIGLREGLEASLVIGILVAFLVKNGKRSALPAVRNGVISAVGLSLAVGAFFTFGAQSLSFKAQEIIGGSLSILAVVMITSMVFVMLKAGRNMKSSIEDKASEALNAASGKKPMFWLAFITVGREGLETTLMLWGWAMQPAAFAGVLIGLAVAVALGYLLYRNVIRLNYQAFFTWTSFLLIFVAAGVLAYGVHDLQEAAVLPGPFSGAPITPTDFRTGEVLTGFFTPYPYWGVAFPFGWAFDVQDTISPDGFLGAVLKGTIGFTPQMSWLEVSAWFVYVAIVLPLFIAKTRSHKKVSR